MVRKQEILRNNIFLSIFFHLISVFKALESVKKNMRAQNFLKKEKDTIFSSRFFQNKIQKNDLYVALKVAVMGLSFS